MKCPGIALNISFKSCNDTLLHPLIFNTAADALADNPD